MNTTKISFGTDGIRGNAQKHPFTNDSLKKLGISIAKWALNKYQKNNPKILVAHDSRISGKRIKESLFEGLCNYPVEIIDAEILPTPAVCKLVQKTELAFDFGIIISASHNPYKDNGIKIVDRESGKLESNDEKLIENNFQKINSTNTDQNKEKKGFVKKNIQLDLVYKKDLSKFFKAEFLSKTKVVLDCANGATSKIASSIFESFGADIFAINDSPNGTNINHNCGSTNPKNLQEKVLKLGAQIGFAFDGDGDRVIAVNSCGKIICGDMMLAILSQNPNLSLCKTVVGTIMTNLGLDRFLRKNDKKLIRTKVGDKHIAKELDKNNFLLGGESSGHIIIKDFMNVGDGIFTALRVLETIILKKNWDMNLFNPTPQILINVPVAYKKDLNLKPYSEIIENEKKLLKNGRIVVRYSGTENLLRIMTEDGDENLANNIALSLSRKLVKALE